MKTNIYKKIFRGLSLVLMTLVLANCAKSGNKSSSVTAANQYYTCYSNAGQTIQNHFCTSNTHSTYYICRDQAGSQVNNSLCANANYNTSHGNYRLQNGTCYQTYNNQVVDPSYCYNNNGGQIAQSCATGTFYYQSMMIQCGVTHICPSGLLLQTTTGQTIRCQ